MSKYKLELPPVPDGKDFARDSFWWTYRERFAMPMKFGWKIKPIAKEWFDREENSARLESKPFPPAPHFGKSSRLKHQSLIFAPSHLSNKWVGLKNPLSNDLPRPFYT